MMQAFIGSLGERTSNRQHFVEGGRSLAFTLEINKRGRGLRVIQHLWRRHDSMRTQTDHSNFVDGPISPGKRRHHRQEDGFQGERLLTFLSGIEPLLCLCLSIELYLECCRLDYCYSCWVFRRSSKKMLQGQESNWRTIVSHVFGWSNPNFQVLKVDSLHAIGHCCCCASLWVIS